MVRSDVAVLVSNLNITRPRNIRFIFILIFSENRTFATFSSGIVYSDRGSDLSKMFIGIRQRLGNIVLSS